MHIFDTIYPSNQEGHQEAIDYLKGMVWSEVETTEQPQPKYSKYIEQYEGIALYYDYGADYYFFVDFTG